VGFIGAVTFIIGAAGLIFVQTLFQLIISFGVIQGLSLLLLFCVFKKKINRYWIWFAHAGITVSFQRIL